MIPVIVGQSAGISADTGAGRKITLAANVADMKGNHHRKIAK
jgi:hypothetical protein